MQYDTIRYRLDIVHKGGHMTTATTIRMDESIKSQATDILESIGLGLNTYVNLALRQLVNQRRIPFELIPAEDTPNEETRRAMVLAEAKELGIVKDNAPSFDDADMLMASLDED